MSLLAVLIRLDVFLYLPGTTVIPRSVNVSCAGKGTGICEHKRKNTDHHNQYQSFHVTPPFSNNSYY
jgi:hypothetical protein